MSTTNLASRLDRKRWRHGLALILICGVLMGSLAPIPVAAQVPVPPVKTAQTGPEGTWAGGFWLDGEWTFAELKLDRRARRWTGTLTLPYAGESIPIDAVSFSDPTLQFEARTEQQVLTIRADLDQDSLAGKILWEPGPASEEDAGTDRLGTFHASRVVVISGDDDVLAEYVGDYRFLPDETPLFVGRSGLKYPFYLSRDALQIGLLPLGADRFLTTTGHEVTFERFDGEEVVGFIIEGQGPLPWTLPERHIQTAAGTEDGAADGDEDGDVTRATAVKVGNYRTEEVRFANGSVLLTGTVVLPHGPGPYPGVIFVHGSGPHTRESYRELAAIFAREGIASLIYDKRGSGGSRGRLSTASLYDLVEDALAGLRVLKPYPEVDLEAIGMWGISEGGWIAPLAAIWSDEEVAFVITVSGPGMSPAAQEMYRWRNDLLDLGATPRELDAGLKAVRLRQDRRRLGAPAADTLFPGVDLDHYAVSVLERVQQPLLALWGDQDRTVPPWTSASNYEAALARGGNEDATLLIFPGAGHHMNLVAETETAPGEVDGPWTSYPSGYTALMTGWVLARTTLSGADAEPAEPDIVTLDPDRPRAVRERLPAPTAPWYGRSVFRGSVLVSVTLLLLSGGVVWSAMVVRRLRSRRLNRHRQRGRPAALPAPLWALGAAAAAVLLGAVLLVTVIAVPARFLMVDAGTLLGYLRSPLVRGAAWIAPLTALGLAAMTAWAWVRRTGSVPARIHLTAVAVAALAVLPLLAYWRLLS